MEDCPQGAVLDSSALLEVFKYLEINDLLKASGTCVMWRDVANHPSLWETVRLKHSRVQSLKGMADALEKHETVHLDMRGMKLSKKCKFHIWPEFITEMQKVKSLRKIELRRCPVFVVEQLAIRNPNLEVITAVILITTKLNMAPISKLSNLQELRLRSPFGLTLISDLKTLSELKQLKHLSLTHITNLTKLPLSVIADLQNLESLHLGQCVDLPQTFASEILSKLEKLKRLRLEKCQGNCFSIDILETVKCMKKLEHLDLVNWDIKPGFDLALGACTNIKKLLVIPTYLSQSAITNHMVLGGVLRLQATLLNFVWGMSMSSLRVTGAFLDENNGPDQNEEWEYRWKFKKNLLISILDKVPILKPVPMIRDGSIVEIPLVEGPPQAEILDLPFLQELLSENLPITSVSILKIPDRRTWKQGITDEVD